MIPDKKTNINSLSLTTKNNRTKAIEIRRRMAEVPELMAGLSKIETYIFSASTKLQINELTDEILVKKSAQLFRFIAIDVGYTIPSQNDWSYICTRLLDVLKRYFSNLTLSEIKLAFELALTGSLDDYLPRDGRGDPDKKHYQQFNVDYFCKILNAYIKKRGEVIEKVYKSLPAPEIQVEEKEKYHQLSFNRLLNVFLRYKYKGTFRLGLVDGMFFYNILKKASIIDEIKEQEEDRRKALSIYLQRVAKGFTNRYEAYRVQKKRVYSPELDFIAFEIARDKEIQRAFYFIASNEIQMTDLLTSYFRGNEY